VGGDVPGHLRAAVPGRRLGRLSIAKSYSTELKAEKEVKTKVPRDLPVHPVLASLLAEWKLSGWLATFGRTPERDDLIIPSRLGKNRSANHMLKKFHQDLGRLGIPRSCVRDSACRALFGARRWPRSDIGSNFYEPKAEYRDYLIVHEVTHYAQFVNLKFNAAVMDKRGAAECRGAYCEKAYNRPAALRATSLSELNIVDSRFPLEAIANHVGLSQTGYKFGFFSTFSSY